MNHSSLKNRQFRIDQGPRTILPKLKRVILGSLLLSSPSLFAIDKIEITMSPESRNSLYADEKVEVATGVTGRYLSPEFTISDLPITIESRGQSSIQFQRKNYAIKSVDSHVLSKTILTAGSMDPLNIKNQIMYKLYRLVGVPALETRLAELSINQKSEGLYMITQAPEHFLLDNNFGYDIVLRRRYADVIELKKAKKSLSEAEVVEYMTSLSQLHKKSRQLKGSALLDFLASNLDLKSYFRMLGINYLTKNGDFADEIFFAGKKDANGHIKFVAVPWDLDDSFAIEMHKQNIPFSPNAGREELAERVLMYGFESQADQAIAGDSTVLKAYFAELKEMMSLLTPEVLSGIVEKVTSDVRPYLAIPEVLESGRWDAGEKDYKAPKILADMEVKKSLLLSRASLMNQELMVAESESPARAHKISQIRYRLGNLFMKAMRHFSKDDKGPGPLTVK